MQVTLGEIRSLIRDVLTEASRTPRPKDLKQGDLLRVLDAVIGFSHGDLEFTEKLAGQHSTIVVQPDGSVLSAVKSQLSMGYKPAGKHAFPNVVAAIEANHPNIGRPVEYRFEVIRPHNRPDYIAYVTGGRTHAIEYGGSMTQDTAQRLNANDQGVTFHTRENITMGSQKLPREMRARLMQARGALRHDRPGARERVAKLISDVVDGYMGGSLLGGGPIEGIVTRLGDRTIKVPATRFADLQKKNVGMYAMFKGGRGARRWGVVKKRFTDYAKNQDDSFVSNVLTHIEDSARQDVGPGYRTFFSPEEARSMLSDIRALRSGDEVAGARLATKIRDRVKDPSSWHTGV